jgi:hypothetical protein
MFSCELDSKQNRQAKHRYGTDEITELKAGGLMIFFKEGRGPKGLIFEFNDNDDNWFANILRLSCVNFQTEIGLKSRCKTRQ